MLNSNLVRSWKRSRVETEADFAKSDEVHMEFRYRDTGKHAKNSKSSIRKSENPDQNTKTDTKKKSGNLLYPD